MIYNSSNIIKFKVLMLSIRNFKADFISGCEQAISAGKNFGKMVFTFDRTNQVLGNTKEAQLKGRSRVICHSIIPVALLLLLTVFSIHGCLLNSGGVGSYIGAAVFGSLGILGLKEIAAQSVARAKEKKAFGIKEESSETWYSVHDFKAEIVKAIKLPLDKLKRT